MNREPERILELQSRVTKAVDQSINPAACLAVGALTEVKALIVRNICNGVYRVDRISADGIHGTIDGCNTCNLATVVANGLNGLLGSKAGGAGCHQDQNVLAPDHGLGVVAENDLGVGVVFRLRDVNGIVV